MINKTFAFVVAALGLILPACSLQRVQAAPTAANTVEPSPVPATSLVVKPTETRRPTPPETPIAGEKVELDSTRLAQLFPLAERGPFFTGSREYEFIDESRAGRRIGVTLMYPALHQTDAEGRDIRQDAVPDMGDAPYALILTGANTGDYLFQSHLASHGFVMAIVRYPDEYVNWDFGVLDHPLDMLFALDQITSNRLEGLDGFIDSDHVGVAGYSWEGFYSLALSGVRIAPDDYLSYCEQAPSEQPAFQMWYVHYTCDLSKKWDAFSVYAGEEITASEDGLWQPVTDERLRAFMPMAPDGAWLYGERGLAAVERPVFIIQATEDNAYQRAESRFIFEHLGTSERFMVSFIGRDHMMVFNPGEAKRMNHFATAYFGYYLQGRQDYAGYFSKDFVVQFGDLAWGVYGGE